MKQKILNFNIEYKIDTRYYIYYFRYFIDLESFFKLDMTNLLYFNMLHE